MKMLKRGEDEALLRLEKCPFCEGDTYYIKSYVKGVVPYLKSFKNNKSVDNSSMYDSLITTYNCDYVYCNSCNRRICKIQDLDTEERN